MALQSSGQISLTQIATEFGDSAPHSLSEFYSASAGIPSSGAISLADFYGATSYTPWYSSVTLINHPLATSTTSLSTLQSGITSGAYILPISDIVTFHLFNGDLYLGMPSTRLDGSGETSVASGISVSDIVTITAQRVFYTTMEGFVPSPTGWQLDGVAGTGEYVKLNNAADFEVVYQQPVGPPVTDQYGNTTYSRLWYIIRLQNNLFSYRSGGGSTAVSTPFTLAEILSYTSQTTHRSTNFDSSGGLYNPFIGNTGYTHSPVQPVPAGSMFYSSSYKFEGKSQYRSWGDTGGGWFKVMEAS